jgi:hypothetical protein
MEVIVRIIVVIAAFIGLAACGPIGQPVVNMAGVDPGKESADMAWCYKHMQLEFGNAVAHCMEHKGYNVLFEN